MITVLIIYSRSETLSPFSSPHAYFDKLLIHSLWVVPPWVDCIAGDGTRVVAVQSSEDGAGLPGSVWQSTDSGGAWSKLDGVPSGHYSAVALSGNGAVLAVVQEKDAFGAPGSVYTSADSGGSWIENTVLERAHWSGVSVSSDGSLIMATQGDNSSAGLFMGSFRSIPAIGVVVAAAAAAGVAAGVGLGKFILKTGNAKEVRGMCRDVSAGSRN